MPSQFDAYLLHAALYLRKIDTINDQYQLGGDDMLAALNGFAQDWPNFQAAQKWSANFSAATSQESLRQDEVIKSVVGFCNVSPDAGAYLISLRLNAQERIRWLEAALQASCRLENQVTTQAHLGNLGLAHYEQGEIQTAIQYFEQALA